MNQPAWVVAVAAALLLTLAAVMPEPAVTQEPPPPLKATLFFRDPPVGVTFDPTHPATPITIVVQIENVSGAAVVTTEGFSSTEFWRRLYFTAPDGGIITNTEEAGIHRGTRVRFCFSRQGVLQNPTIPVVPIEVLAGPPSTAIAVPSAPTLTPSPSGGALSTGTYFYRVSAFDAKGIETAASGESSVFVIGPTGSVAISWAPVTGATGYRVYRGTTPGGQNVYYSTATNSLVDTGSPARFGLPAPFTIQYVIDDARRFYDLSRDGEYTVDGRVPFQEFLVSDPNALIRDCDQFATDVANVAATSGRRAFTILSNRLSFRIQTGVVREPPTISDIGDQVTAEDTATPPIPFTIGDKETLAANLTVSGRSSDPALVPDVNIVFGGSGANRTVTVTPALNQVGTTTITVTVTDADGMTATDSFKLTVTAVNDAPTISDIPNQGTGTNQPITIAFTVGDVDNDPATLTLTGSSSNTTLVPNINIVFGGSGTSRTVTITPAADQTGQATITITVSDGSLTASDSFVLFVETDAGKAKAKAKGQ